MALQNHFIDLVLSWPVVNGSIHFPREYAEAGYKELKFEGQLNECSDRQTLKYCYNGDT